MISLEQMLSSSVHLGHRVQQWNPKMSRYIYAQRKGIHIIDLLQTLVLLEKACKFLSIMSRKNRSVLFIGTKRQLSSVVENAARISNSHFVTQRWLGGMLTNWLTIKNCIDNLRLLIKQELDGSINLLTKKESINLKKKRAKLEKYLVGVKNMTAVPDVVILVGQIRELNAVKECLKLNIPLITIIDTNCDPTLTDFVVPANDDSVSSVSLILNELSASIQS